MATVRFYEESTELPVNGQIVHTVSAGTTVFIALDTNHILKCRLKIPSSSSTGVVRLDVPTTYATNGYNVHPVQELTCDPCSEGQPLRLELVDEWALATEPAHGSIHKLTSTLRTTLSSLSSFHSPRRASHEACDLHENLDSHQSSLSSGGLLGSTYREKVNNEHRIHRLFVDATGSHLLVSMTDGWLYYWYFQWLHQGIQVANFPQTTLQAVSWWSLSSSVEHDPTPQISALAGTIGGDLYELRLRINSPNRIRVDSQLLMRCSHADSPITGIKVLVQDLKHKVFQLPFVLALISTNRRLYYISGCLEDPKGDMTQASLRNPWSLAALFSHFSPIETWSSSDMDRLQQDSAKVPFIEIENSSEWSELLTLPTVFPTLSLENRVRFSSNPSANIESISLERTFLQSVWQATQKMPCTAMSRYMDAILCSMNFTESKNDACMSMMNEISFAWVTSAGILHGNLYIQPPQMDKATDLLRIHETVNRIRIDYENVKSSTSFIFSKMDEFIHRFHFVPFKNKLIHQPQSIQSSYCYLWLLEGKTDPIPEKPSRTLHGYPIIDLEGLTTIDISDKYIEYSLPISSMIIEQQLNGLLSAPIFSRIYAISISMPSNLSLPANASPFVSKSLTTHSHPANTQMQTKVLPLQQIPRLGLLQLVIEDEGAILVQVLLDLFERFRQNDDETRPGFGFPPWILMMKAYNHAKLMHGVDPPQTDVERPSLIEERNVLHRHNVHCSPSRLLRACAGLLVKSESKFSRYLLMAAALVDGDDGSRIPMEKNILVDRAFTNRSPQKTSVNWRLYKSNREASMSVPRSSRDGDDCFAHVVGYCPAVLHYRLHGLMKDVKGDSAKISETMPFVEAFAWTIHVQCNVLHGLSIAKTKIVQTLQNLRIAALHHTLSLLLPPSGCYHLDIKYDAVQGFSHSSTMSNQSILITELYLQCFQYVWRSLIQSGHIEECLTWILAGCRHCPNRPQTFDALSQLLKDCVLCGEFSTAQFVLDTLFFTEKKQDKGMQSIYGSIGNSHCSDSNCIICSMEEMRDCRTQLDPSKLCWFLQKHEGILVKYAKRDKSHGALNILWKYIVSNILFLPKEYEVGMKDHQSFVQLLCTLMYMVFILWRATNKESDDQFVSLTMQQQLDQIIHVTLEIIQRLVDVGMFGRILLWWQVLHAQCRLLHVLITDQAHIFTVASHEPPVVSMYANTIVAPVPENIQLSPSFFQLTLPEWKMFEWMFEHNQHNVPETTHHVHPTKFVEYFWKLFAQTLRDPEYALKWILDQWQCIECAMWCLETMQRTTWMVHEDNMISPAETTGSSAIDGIHSNTVSTTVSLCNPWTLPGRVYWQRRLSCCARIIRRWASAHGHSLNHVHRRDSLDHMTKTEDHQGESMPLADDSIQSVPTVQRAVNRLYQAQQQFMDGFHLLSFAQHEQPISESTSTLATSYCGLCSGCIHPVSNETMATGPPNSPGFKFKLFANCGHVFHETCIDLWIVGPLSIKISNQQAALWKLQIRRSCPLCSLHALQTLE